MHATSHTLNEMFDVCQAHVVFFKILPKCKKNPAVLPTNAFCEIFGKRTTGFELGSQLFLFFQRSQY
jgi:hypothetical protein